MSVQKIPLIPSFFKLFRWIFFSLWNQLREIQKLCYVCLKIRFSSRKSTFFDLVMTKFSSDSSETPYISGGPKTVLDEIFLEIWKSMMKITNINRFKKFSFSRNSSKKLTMFCVCGDFFGKSQPTPTGMCLIYYCVLQLGKSAKNPGFSQGVQKNILPKHTTAFYQTSF